MHWPRKVACGSIPSFCRASIKHSVTPPSPTSSVTIWVSTWSYRLHYFVTRKILSWHFDDRFVAHFPRCHRDRRLWWPMHWKRARISWPQGRHCWYERVIRCIFQVHDLTPCYRWLVRWHSRDTNELLLPRSWWQGLQGKVSFARWRDRQKGKVSIFSFFDRMFGWTQTDFLRGYGTTDYSNIMGYSQLPQPCTNHFTDCQELRMHCWACAALQSQMKTANCWNRFATKGFYDRQGLLNINRKITNKSFIKGLFTSYWIPLILNSNRFCLWRTIYNPFSDVSVSTKALLGGWSRLNYDSWVH